MKSITNTETLHPNQECFIRGTLKNIDLDGVITVQIPTSRGGHQHVWLTRDEVFTEGAQHVTRLTYPAPPAAPEPPPQSDEQGPESALPVKSPDDVA